MVAELKDLRGINFKIDAEDRERVEKYKWYAVIANFNAKIVFVTSVDEVNKKKLQSDGIEFKKNETTITLSRFLLNYDEEKFEVVFRNLDRTDFRKENLVTIPKEYAMLHKEIAMKHPHPYRGILKVEKSEYVEGEYKARIFDVSQGKMIHSKRVSTIEEAAAEYNNLSRQMYGDFGYFNVIGVDPRIQRKELGEIIEKIDARDLKTGVYFRGDFFKSLAELGKYTKLGSSLVKHFNLMGKTSLFCKDITKDVERLLTGKKSFVLEGKPFESISDIAKHYGLTDKTVMSLVNRYDYDGVVVLEKIKERISKEKLIYKENEYKNYTDLCKKLKLEYTNFLYVLTNTGDIDFAVRESSVESIANKKTVKRHKEKISFKGNEYNTYKECFAAYGHSAQLRGSFAHKFPELDPLDVFSVMLDFIEENKLEKSGTPFASLPMVYYNGEYFQQAKDFYELIGTNTRVIGHARNHVDAIGMSEEEVILNMRNFTRYGSEQKGYFDNSSREDDHVLYFRNGFYKYLEQRKSN